MQPLKGTVCEGVLHPAAATYARDQTRFPQQSQVVAQQIGGDRHGGLQVTHAPRALRCQTSEQTQTDRVGHGAQQRGPILQLFKNA